MNNILFYLQHYLTPSMTFIYRQLVGTSKKKNVAVLCSRKLENTEIFPYDHLIYAPVSKFYSRFLRAQEILFNKPAYSFLNTQPKLSLLKRKELEKLILKLKSNLIHAHFGPSGLEIFPIAHKLNLPLIVSFHGYDASILLKRDIYRQELKKMMKNISIVTPSEYMLNSLHDNGITGKQEFVIHYGIPLDYFHYQQRLSLFNKVTQKEEIVFLQVSNFVEKKGHIFTIKAFHQFVHSYYNRCKLVLAGDGPFRKEMENLVNELGLKEKVVFPGLVYQNQVRDLMYAADIFVHHSITSSNGDMEGIPNVIMEAMATGLPVISTYHAGIPELIDDTVDGLLVNEKDVNNYTKKMLDILNDNGELGLNARQKIEEKFNLRLQNNKLISLYENLL